MHVIVLMSDSLEWSWDRVLQQVLKQEAHGPQVAHLSKTATAYLQMPCNIATATRTEIWQCLKKAKGHPKIYIWTKLVDLASPMLYTKIQPQSILGSGEKNYFNHTLPLVFSTFSENDFLTFSPYQSMVMQIWHCHEKVKGPRIIIWTNSVDPESSMLYTKIKPWSLFGSKEDIFKCFFFFFFYYIWAWQPSY